ncbi:ATP-binding protein [Pseudalkalibacillus sp. Hm43]|uniref:ATP-binding protein n=1 Tax=Pseudalkalibacillus sp. Hm43 TaxID=3450742 RepID=UPI003F443593
MITEINGKKLDFHQLLEYSITAKFIVKANEIVYANKACLRLLGLNKPEDILNKPFRQFLHPDFHILNERYLHQVCELGKTVEQVECCIVDAEGRIIEVESTYGVYEFDGETLVQVIMQDITDRKETEKQLMQSEKLSVMGELATGIVHEVRNPLTILKGFLKIMDKETSPKGKEYIKIMLGELDRINTIANDLLYFSKPHDSNIHPHNIVRIIQEVIFLLDTSAFRKRISIHIHSEEDHIEVVGDEVQLKQAFINFIKNAIEATSQEGHISVHIDKGLKDISISIMDTGCGMTGEQLEKLGTSFYSTKENGTGLGLMVTYNIIKNHHGHVTVGSTVGQGTTFTVRLPISTQEYAIV